MSFRSVASLFSRGLRLPAYSKTVPCRFASARVQPDLLPRSLRLDDLRDNAGAVKDVSSLCVYVFGALFYRGSLSRWRQRKRKGRGEGSGMGRTAGRGMKGTKARSGGSVALGFEGGQSPLWRRTPKIGFMPKSLRKPLEPVNLDVLQLFIDQGRIDASK